MSDQCQATKCRQEAVVRLYGVWLCERHDKLASEMMQRGHKTLHAVTAMIPSNMRQEVQP